jgi:hypothetical protein
MDASETFKMIAVTNLSGNWTLLGSSKVRLGGLDCADKFRWILDGGNSGEGTVGGLAGNEQPTCF